MIKHYIGLSLISASLLMAGCSSSDDDADPGTTTGGTTTGGTTTGGSTTGGASGYMAPADATAPITDALPAELINALSANNIALADGTNYTIFAPTSAAIATAQEAGGLLDPATTTEAQSAVLTYHVVEGVYAAAPGETGATQIATGNLTTLNGALAAVVIDAAGNTFAGANISATDSFGTNGVVHTIDAVADPANAPTTGTTTGGTTTGGTTTGGTTTGGATAGGTTTGGGTGTECGQDAPVAGTMYEAIAGDANLTSIMGMLQDSGLGQFCINMNDSANGPWTFFAPTNGALAAFTGTAAVTTLQDHIYTNGSLEDEAALAAQASSAVGLANAGNRVTVTVGSAPLTVNGFNVVNSIVTSNGTVHVIDGVLE